MNCNIAAMLKFIRKKLSILLLLLTASAAGAVYLAMRKDWLFFIAIVFVWLLLFRGLQRYYKKNAQKIAFLFDSIDNGDQAFHFAERGASPGDEIVNNALNRINKILSQAKAEIIQKEKYYELIINSVNTGILVIDEAGFVFQTNKEVLRLLGLSVFTHVKQLSKIDPKLEEMISKVHPGEKHQISFTNEWGIVNLLIQVSGIETQSGKVRIIALNDIDKELAEKEMESWVRLTRVLTHEIMNSITPITSLSETLLRSYGNVNPVINDGLQVINSTGKSLISFVESYRKFAIIPVPVPSLFYILPFAGRMKQLMLHRTNCPNIQIVIDIAQEDLIVYADENLISRVVLNLLKNAVEAIEEEKEGGLVVFRAYCDKHDAVIMEICNTGPAILPEVMEHIFVPFFTTKEKGNGIGLSVSRQIMRLSGGSLSVKSDAAAKQTCFTLTFP